jgi:uncharacterized cysteine cluster protein YcgN (CxxCxxCC family)
MNQPEPELPFWQRKPLNKMTRAEWESLCDGCARCCIIRYEDEDTGEFLNTDVVCKLLDLDSCRCTHYGDRSRLVPTCLTLTPKLVNNLPWMPETCAYRLLAEGKPLAGWHPLVSGRSETVFEAGISVHGWVISEREIPPDELEDHIIDPDLE